MLQVAAVLTAGGVLLGLVLTTSGTVAAMARDRHLPVALAVREGPHLLPRRALVVVAAFIVFLGDQLGVGSQLSTGVVVVLGVRIFSNVASIRRHLFNA